MSRKNSRQQHRFDSYYYVCGNVSSELIYIDANKLRSLMEIAISLYFMPQLSTQAVAYLWFRDYTGASRRQRCVFKCKICNVDDEPREAAGAGFPPLRPSIYGVQLSTVVSCRTRPNLTRNQWPRQVVVGIMDFSYWHRLVIKSRQAFERQFVQVAESQRQSIR